MDIIESNDKVEGRNPVLELLEASDRSINKLFVISGERHGSIQKIIAIAKEKKIVINEVSKSKLDQMSETKNHQGVIATVAPYQYVDVDDLLQVAKNKNQQALLIIADGIEDPHNLGSIIRTAECAGAHGIIIPKRRSVSVTPTVAKTSAGAIEHIGVARVNNISDTIDYLKKQGLWIIGTDMDARDVHYNTDLTGPVAIVVGSEGSGMGRLVKENCDILTKIPMTGNVTSLNASVASAIIIYEVIRQRNLKNK